MQWLPERPLFSLLYLLVSDMCKAGLELAITIS